MNDLTPEQRARALELHRLYFRTLTGVESAITDAANMSPSSAKAWLAVKAHVLASHTCPDVESDARVRAWNTIAQHPFFADCYQTEDTLVDALVAKLDAAHTHTCKPAWRPTTADEIQPGWEVRSRRNGYEAMWGIAHRRDRDGDWCTEAGALLTYASAGWTYETTAPAPEPESWDEELVGMVAQAVMDHETTNGYGRPEALGVLDALAARGYLDRAAIAGGEQS